MEILYADATLLVASKPPRVLSTDEPGGMPDLLRQALGDPAANVRTVHRLDRVVGGAMVFARTKRAARELSTQITDGGFGKRYLAIVHGAPTPPAGRMEDELWRDKARRMTFAMPTPGDAACCSGLSDPGDTAGQELGNHRPADGADASDPCPACKPRPAPGGRPEIHPLAGPAGRLRDRSLVQPAPLHPPEDGRAAGIFRPAAGCAALATV